METENVAITILRTKISLFTAMNSVLVRLIGICITFHNRDITTDGVDAGILVDASSNRHLSGRVDTHGHMANP